MDTLDILFGSISRLAESFRLRKISPTELLGLSLERIDRLNPRLHAFITVAPEQALTAAKDAEQRLRQDDPGPLVGIPIAVKDSIATKGMRTTANSRVLEDWIPQRDAAVVERLRQAGAVIIGKTNLNEFGWSIPSDEDLCAPPPNPWNLAFAAVGSSSGSGVAVAAGLCTAALGTDGGGSVRLPAGQLGLVGLKATHALVSRTGVLHAGSIGDVGPLARTVTDTAILLSTLAGYDSEDPDIRPFASVVDTRHPDGGLTGIRLGVPRGYMESVPVEDDVRETFETALGEFTRLGAVVQDIELPILEHARTANFVVLNAEHYAAHAGMLWQRWLQYGPSARLYLAQGAFVSAADYLCATEVRRLARVAVNEALAAADVIAVPTSAVVTAEAARQPEVHRRGIGASFTSPFNLTGHPALSIPCGMSRVGLPIGLQLVAQWHGEPVLFRVARAYEEATPWHSIHPSAEALTTSAPGPR